MAYHPRIETSEYGDFLTTRSRNSELWFVNNEPLEEALLGYLSRYKTRYDVKIYAFAIEGNHIQMTAEFPKPNRSDFMRDFNSTAAKAVQRYVPSYPGGSLWGRRYSNEFLPSDGDIETRFFYTVLQPVQDGLVEKISEYPGYNCFNDAIWGVEKTYKVIRWAEYNAARRYKEVPIIQYTEIVKLKYDRLPGYEELSQKEYANLMMKKLEEKRVEIVTKRYKDGLGFMGRDRLLQVRAGSIPFNTKRSHRYSFRPRVLAPYNARGNACRDWYFDKYNKYKVASAEYRRGNYAVVFPDGMYKPYVAAAPPAG